MRRPRQRFPYTRGTAVVLSAGTLNLLAQLRAPGESWTQCIAHIAREWAVAHDVVVYETATVIEVLRTRPRQRWDEISQHKENADVKPS